MQTTRPIVRYHGGKWILAPWIISNFPPHRIYTEVFGGAASVLLRKSRVYAEVYNDLDGEIVNLFQVARDHGQQLKELLRLTPYSRAEFDLSYEPSENPIEQARRTVVRAFMGFGSNGHNSTKTGFRAKSSKSNTSSASDWANYPKAFESIIDRLQGVVIENRDALEILKAQDSISTLHYVDPPYVTETRYNGKDYRHELTDSDHRDLFDTLQSLKGMVVLSGYDCELYQALYSSWKCIRKDALADGAKKRVECLWFNDAAVKHTRQKTIFDQLSN